MKLTVETTLEPRQLAELFCALTDEEQAQFFIEAASVARETFTPMGPWWQWTKVGEHLRDCTCSTDDGRQMVRDIADGIASTPVQAGAA